MVANPKETTLHGGQSRSWSAEKEKKRKVCIGHRVKNNEEDNNVIYPMQFMVHIVVSNIISILRLNLVLTYGIPPEFRGGVHLSIYLNHHTPSDQSRVYRVT